MGIIIIESDRAPAHTEKDPSTRTTVTYPTMPMTIEGSPVKTLLRNRTAEGNIPFPANSERYIPVSTPTGVAINDAKPTTIIVPWIAGPIPPFPEPIEPCVATKNSKLSAATPFFTTSSRILPSGIIGSNNAYYSKYSSKPIDNNTFTISLFHMSMKC